MEQFQENALKRVYSNVVVIWVIFLVSIFLYGVLVYVWEKKLSPLPPIESIKQDMKNTFVVSFAFLSISQMFVCAFLQKMLLNTETIAQKIKTTPDVVTVGGALMRSFIINLAFRESIAVYGLGLYMIFHSVYLFYYFAIPSFFLILIVYPSFNSWKEQAELVLRHMPEARIFSES